MPQTGEFADAAPAKAIDPMMGERDLIAPRIAIEVFCKTPDFATAVRAAAEDRRMVKASCELTMGGAKAAVKRYASVATPNLIVIESDEPGFGVFEELEALAEVCDADTRVAVAGPSNDVTLYRELMKKGVCEYLVTPCSPLQIIEAIVTAFDDPDAAPAARTIAVMGARGGAGSSVISHNIASLLSQRTERQTVMVDLDLAFGTAGLDFNVASRTNVADALAEVDALDDVMVQRLLTEYSEHLQLLTAPSSFDMRARTDEEAVVTLFDAVRFMCDFAVFDLPHQWSDLTRASLRHAEAVVLVATPDLTCLRNVKTMFEWLRAERKQDAAPLLVLNQVGQPKREQIDAAEFAKTIDAQVAAEIPYDPAAFGAAQSEGEMLSEVVAGKRVAEKLVDLTMRLSGRDPHHFKAQKQGFSLSNLFGAFSG